MTFDLVNKAVSNGNLVSSLKIFELKITYFLYLDPVWFVWYYFDIMHLQRISHLSYIIWSYRMLTLLNWPKKSYLSFYYLVHRASQVNIHLGDNIGSSARKKELFLSPLSFLFLYIIWLSQMFKNISQCEYYIWVVSVVIVIYCCKNIYQNLILFLHRDLKSWLSYEKYDLPKKLKCNPCYRLNDNEHWL